MASHDAINVFKIFCPGPKRGLFPAQPVPILARHKIYSNRGHVSTPFWEAAAGLCSTACEFGMTVYACMGQFGKRAAVPSASLHRRGPQRSFCWGAPCCAVGGGLPPTTVSTSHSVF